MTTQLHHLLTRYRQAELADRAERLRQIRDGQRPDPGPQADVAITLRLAGDGDGRAIADLAGLDSANVPAGPVLIAEAGGNIRAAVSLRDGTMIADPFQRTLAAQDLLRARAAQLRGDRGRGRFRRGLGRGQAPIGLGAISPSTAVGTAAADHHD